MNYLRILQLRRMGAMMAPDAGGAGTEPAQEAPDGEQTAAEGRNEGNAAQGQTGEKTFTQADIDRIVRREQAKWKRQQETAVQSARSEAERLATMTDEERAQEQARQREAELTRREAEITRRELRAQALETLAKEQLPAELADVLDYADAQRCGESIKAVKSAFQAAVKKGVDERVRSGAPKAGRSQAADGVEAAFARLNPGLKLD